MLSVTRVVVAVAILSVGAGATPAFANSPSGYGSVGTQDHPKTVVIDGTEYGPWDGLVVDARQFEIEPGAGPVGVVFDDRGSGRDSITLQAVWGSSYAISTETLQFFYDGKAKAAANVFDGKRIIQVCIWYTRGLEVVSAKVCSTANFLAGAWNPGPEVRVSTTDSLDPNAPVTTFRISTIRINP